MTTETEMPDGGDWKRAVNEYIDKNFEKLNDANAKEHQCTRDGQTTLFSDVKCLVRTSTPNSQVRSRKA